MAGILTGNPGRLGKPGKFAVVITLILLSISLAYALNAGNIDLIYYNTTTHKPVYEVQFLTTPLAYETGKTPKIIMYGAGTNFSFVVTNYESSKGGVVVKLVNVYDGTERVVGYLTNKESSKVFTVSNLYPGYWKIVIVGTSGLPTWDMSSAAAPTNAGPHEIEIVGNPKLVIALLNPSRNVTIGDYARIMVEVKGLYGTTNVSVVVKGQHELTYSRVLGGANGNVWTLNVPTDKLGVGKCEVTVRAMGITGNLTFNVVPVKVNESVNGSVNESTNRSVNASKIGMNVSKTNVSVNSAVNATRTGINASSINMTNTTNTTKKAMKTANVTANQSVNQSANKSREQSKEARTSRSIKTPGFEAIAAVLCISAAVLLRRFKL